MNSLKDKKCLITGASSGLGLELTKLFILAEAEVIMLCRDEEKSMAIINNLRRDYPNAKIQLELADLSSLKSLQTFTEDFTKRHSSLDILINNAAVLKTRMTKTDDGFESMFQVNFLAPFILTNALIDLLKSGHNPQILNIALPPENLRLNFDDLQSLNSFKPMENLMRTKLCFFLFSIELADRLNNAGIKVITGVPNNRPFKTNLGREMPFFMKMVMTLISMKTEKIAINIPSVLLKNDIRNGYVFKGQNAVSLTPYWQNSEVRELLWEDTEQLLIN